MLYASEASMDASEAKHLASAASNVASRASGRSAAEVVSASPEGANLVFAQCERSEAPASEASSPASAAALSCAKRRRREVQQARSAWSLFEARGTSEARVASAHPKGRTIVLYLNDASAASIRYEPAKHPATVKYVFMYVYKKLYMFKCQKSVGGGGPKKFRVRLRYSGGVFPTQK